MGKKLVGINKTEQEIFDFMYVNYPKGSELDYLEKWIRARDGSIIDVFIEYLEVFRNQNFLSEEEEHIIEDYRCLSKNGKAKVNDFLCRTYSEEYNKKEKNKRIK